MVVLSGLNKLFFLGGGGFISSLFYLVCDVWWSCFTSVFLLWGVTLSFVFGMLFFSIWMQFGLFYGLVFLGSHRAQLPVSWCGSADLVCFDLSGAHGVLPPITCVGSYLVRTLMGGSEERFRGETAIKPSDTLFNVVVNLY